MKKILFLLLSFCLFSLFAQNVVNISTSEYPPFISEDAVHNGFASHMITLAFKEADYIVKFTYLPWKRSYESAIRGEYDATSYWYVSDERKKDFYYSDPLTNEKIVFFYLKSNRIRKWRKLTDLSRYTIGVTIGTTLTKELWDLGEKGKLNLSQAAEEIQNFKKLIRGRIDLFPTGLVGGYSLLNKEFGVDTALTIDVLEKPLNETTGHLLFSKEQADSSKLLKVFNKGLKKIRKNGIYDKYFDLLLEGYYDKKSE